MAHKKSHRQAHPYDLGLMHEITKELRDQERKEKRRRDNGKNRRRENKW